MSDAREPEPELDADALAFLRAYRAEERIPADVHARVWSRVQADVGPPPVRWLRYGAIVGGLAAAALAVLWVGGRVLRPEAATTGPASQAGYERSGGAPEGSATSRGSESAGPRRATPEERGSEAVVPSLGEESPSTAPKPSLAPEITSAEAEDAGVDAAARSGSSGRKSNTHGERRPASIEPAPVEPAPAPGSTLAEETRLLDQARKALLDARPEEALARLREHARRFPAGILAEERQALRAVALCEAGHDADGDAAAQAFLREHPQAALAQRVRSACLE